jgi:GR25 family glycosyltransferase involved in LPS biosynthesis
MTQPPLYVLNLDRSPARWRHMTRVLGAQGLTFERIAAVDGRSLGADVVAQSPLGPGEHGCFLSHRCAWTRLVASGAPLGHVLEDDVVPHPSYADLVRAGNVMPRGFELMKLDTTWHAVHLGRIVGRAADFVFRPLRSVHWCTGGYTLTRRAALALLEETATSAPRLSVDAYLYLPAGHERRVRAGAPRPRRIVQCVPAPLVSAHRVSPDPDLASTLAAEHAQDALAVPEPTPSRRRSRSLAARIGRELTRPARRLATRLRTRTLRTPWRRRVRVPWADGTTERIVDGRPVRPGLDLRHAPDAEDEDAARPRAPGPGADPPPA